MTEKFCFAMRIAAIPILLAAIAFLEIERPFVSFRLFTFACLFLILADLTSLTQKKIRDVLLGVTSLVLGILVLEAVSDRISPQATLKTTQGLTVRQPVLGWGPQHSGRFHARKIDPKTGTVIYDVDYTIDTNLLRRTDSCETCGTIAFFGDSVTFGEGINDGNTLPQAFADGLDRKERVLNLAYSGYGPQQFLRELETGRFDQVIGPRPKLFVFLTGAWHAQRTACKASWVLYAPRYALENGKLVYKGPCYTGIGLWLQEWGVHAALYRKFIEPDLERLTDDDFELYVRILLAAVSLAEEKYKVPTLIPYLRLPKAYFHGTSFSDDEIIRQLRAGGADVLDLSSLQKPTAGALLAIPGDGHPTPYANRLRAAILKTYIEQNLPEVLVPK